MTRIHSLYFPSPKSEGLQTFVKKTKYTISLIWNRIMNFFCIRKWWHSIDCLKDRKITLGALPLHNRFFKSDLKRLKENRIDAVLILVEPFERKKGIAGHPVTSQELKNANIDFLELKTPDYKPLKQIKLHKAADYIHKITSEGKRILVHCKAGKGRSASAVVAYFLKYHPKTIGITTDSAIAHVKKFRPQISVQFKQRDALLTFKRNLVN